MPTKSNAQLRREQELAQLIAEGATITCVNRYHFLAGGHLHIWTATGRWWHEQKEHRGKLLGITMRDLLRTHSPEALNPPEIPAAHAC